MSVDANIGTIAASVRLDLGGLIGDKAKAETLLQNMTVNITQNLNQSVKNMTSNLQSMAAQQAATMVNTSKPLKAHAAQLAAAVGQIGRTLTGIGVAIVGGLGAAVKVGAEFEAMMNHAANNTSLTNDQISAMREAVIKLGRESGAPLEELATGFQKIVGFGYNTADAMVILRQAMMSAVATGADVSKTADVLAGMMHNFGIKTEDASHAMNVLHVAANDGRMTLEQFVNAAGPTLAMAGAMGASITMVGAAFVALTRHQFSAAEAATQIRNVFIHLAEPGQQVQKLLAAVSQASGVDLVSAFRISAMSGKGMADTLDKVKEAAKNAGLNADDLMLRLVHAMRGGLGAMVLAKTGADDFKNEMVKLDDVWKHGDQTVGQYQKTMGTLDQQVKIAKNNMILLADDIQKALLPAIQPLVRAVGQAAKNFSDLSPGEKSARIEMVAFFGVTALGIGTIATLINKLAVLRRSLATLGITGAGSAIGSALAAVTTGVGGVVTAGAGMMMLDQSGLSSGTLGNANNNARMIRIAQNRARAQVELDKFSAMSSDARLDYVKSRFGTNIFGAPMTGRDDYFAQLRGQISGADSILNASRGSGSSSLPGMSAAGGGGGSTTDFMKGIKDAEASRKKHSSDATQAKRDREDEAKERKRTSDDAIEDYIDTVRAAAESNTEEIANAKKLNLQKALNFLDQGLRQQSFLDDSVDRDREAIAKKIDNQKKFGSLIEQAYSKQNDWEREQTQISIEETDKRMQFDYENMDLSFQNYYDYLQKRINETKKYSEEYYKIISMADAAVKQNDGDNMPEKKNKNRQAGDAIFSTKNIAQGMANVFENALNNLFQHGFKNFFKNVLDGFAQMVEQMIVKWLVFKAITAIFGGAIASEIGFDDGENDRKAVRWGFDFANNFRSGIASSVNQRSYAVAGASGGQQSTVHVNIDNVHVHDDRDIRQLSESVGWHITQQLRAKVGKQ